MRNTLIGRELFRKWLEQFTAFEFFRAFQLRNLDEAIIFQSGQGIYMRIAVCDVPVRAFQRGLEIIRERAARLAVDNFFLRFLIRLAGG